MFGLSEDTKVKFSLKDLIRAFLNEVRDILKQYMSETEVAVKKRLQKLLLTGIIGSILLALIIAFIASAALFLLIGSLKYLSTFMPVWAAWITMGVTAAIIAGALFIVLYLLIRKELSSKKQK